MSWDDLEFWARATEPDAAPNEVPAQYRAALAAFSGSKERVLVLPRKQLCTEQDRILRTVRALVSDGFRLRLLCVEDYSGQDRPDFCLAGDLASYLFQSSERHPDERELVVGLSKEAVADDEQRWTQMLACVKEAGTRAWDSDEQVPLDEYLARWCR